MKNRALQILMVAAVMITLFIVGSGKAQMTETGDLKAQGTTLNLVTSIPRTMTYQGILKDAEGEPIANESKNTTLRIYDDPSAGELEWNETIVITTDEGGYFNATLSNLEIPFDEDYWLELEVDSEILSPRQKLNMVAYAARADSADFTILADNSVSQIKLKTSSGTVERSAYSPPVIISVLPGGEYGFYPQIRAATAVNGRHSVTILGTAGMDAFVPPTSFTTTICLRAEGTTLYARQRYVTSSGRDHWIFFLIDKTTRNIIAGYEAPDHPCYGSGGNEKDIPHPFLNYDPDKHQVILIDNEIIPELKAKVNSRQSLLEVIKEEYEIDFDSKPVYMPREIIEIDEYGEKSGEILRKIKTPEWAKFLIERDEIYLKKRIVKTLPQIISYRKLIPRIGTSINNY